MRPSTRNFERAGDRGARPRRWMRVRRGLAQARVHGRLDLTRRTRRHSASPHAGIARGLHGQRRGRWPQPPRRAARRSVNSKVLASTTTRRIRLNSRSARAPIGLDLRPQRVHVVEPALVAEPLHERQPHARPYRSPEYRSTCVSMVGSVLAERRPHADVGHAGVHDAVDRHRRRVDAVRRNQLVVGLRCSRWETRSRARASAPRRSCRRR